MGPNAGSFGRDVLQGASNAAASSVSAPVDLISWGMRKAGVPVPAEPVGGSDWMAQQRLTAEPQSRLAGALGEIAGGVIPAFAIAKAPQIAGGLVQAGRNMAAPAGELNAGMMRGQRGAVPAGKGIPTSIKSAAIQVGDQTFLGYTHGDAMNKAIYAGALVRKPNGRVAPATKGHRLDFDLFQTNDGQVIDRITADMLFNKSASEQAIEAGMIKPQPARELKDRAGMSVELSRMLYGE